MSSLDDAIEFWFGVLSLELIARRIIGAGPYVENIVGVSGADLHIAIVAAPGGHKNRAA